MHLYKGKKIIIAGCVISLLSTSIIAASKKEKQAEEPLRIPLEREALIDELTTEKLNREKFPVNEEDAIDYKKSKLEEQRIIQAPVKEPEVSFRKIFIDTSKKQNNEVVYLSPNYVTTLQFLDKNGGLWPIQNYTLALGKNIIDKDLNSSSLVLAPKDIQFGRGNLVVMLKGSNEPLIMTVEISPDKVDYKVEFSINDYGPNSQPVIYNTDSKQDMSFMASFILEDLYVMLDGITPAETYIKRRTSLPEDVEVWVRDKVMYVRTKDILISPNMIPFEYNKMQSPDNTYLYTVPYMNVIVLSRHGQINQVKIY
jgi:hypothetical protein